MDTRTNGRHDDYLALLRTLRLDSPPITLARGALGNCGFATRATRYKVPAGVAMNFRRAWDGGEWQEYALRLVQTRHGPQNVQIVPDKVRGDAGIEFFSMDGCLYQCYAPEESADVAKAASAMKSKADRDLAKLVKNKTTISGLLQAIVPQRWILLTPFLDDKAVVERVRSTGTKVQLKASDLLPPSFQALVQSQDDFQPQIELLRQLSLGPPLKVPAPEENAIAAAAGGEQGKRLTDKLSRAFPNLGEVQMNSKREAYVRLHLIQANTIEQLKQDFPFLWERSISSIAAEEARLITIGSTASAPTVQLEASVARIETSLRASLPDVSPSVITELALGTVADWLLRCPLDFS